MRTLDAGDAWDIPHLRGGCVILQPLILGKSTVLAVEEATSPGAGGGGSSISPA